MDFVENLILFTRLENCENRSTFDKVIVDYVKPVFYGPQCAIYVNV